MDEELTSLIVEELGKPAGNRLTNWLIQDVVESEHVDNRCEL